MPLSTTALEIDLTSTATTIIAAVRQQVMGTLHKRGVVLGLSGGIDSSVCAAIAVKAVGRERVCGLLMPEAQSHAHSESLELGHFVAKHFGIEPIVENIAPALEGLGCYQRQIDAIRTVVPDYDKGWKCKITLPSILASGRLNVFSLTVQGPDGKLVTTRMPLPAYLQLVAAMNMKQRTRKQFEYFHADRLNYAVIGTPNRLEYDQGFFVKQGDGAADVKPIAHLYKTQVYALAKELGVPAEICARPPTTDTYSLEQSQEEFYFALPYGKMDLCLYALNEGIAAAEVAPAVGCTEEQVTRVFRDIESKRRATRYLHMPPMLVSPVEQVASGVREAIASSTALQTAMPPLDQAHSDPDGSNAGAGA